MSMIFKSSVITIFLLGVVYGQHDLTRPVYSGKLQKVDLVFRKTAVDMYLKVVLNKTPLEGFSACLWFNTSAANKYHTFIHHSSKKQNYILHLATSSQNNINQWIVYINSKRRTFVVSRPLHDGVWHHVCVTWNGKIGTLTLFMDGEHQSNQTDKELKGSLAFSGDFVYIGQELNSNGQFVNKHVFFGDVSRVNLWDIILNASTISRLSLSCNENTEGNFLSWTSLVNVKFINNVSRRKSTCPMAKGRDCLDLLYKGYKLDGYYLINPDKKSYFNVLCDQQTNGGGWAVIQSRQDGSINFNHDWDTYKIGFGNPHGEFWLGNEQISRLGQKLNYLLIEVKNKNRHEISKVLIQPEENKYGLYTYSHSGTSYYYLYCYTVNSITYFSTKDKDNDGYYGTNYALRDMGGFWLRSSPYCHLNYGRELHSYRVYFRNILSSNPKVQIKLKSLRERDNEYVLSFDGNHSRIYFPVVKGFRDITVCAWIKTELTERLQCLFSFYNKDQRFQLCFNARKAVIHLVDDTRTFNFTETPFNLSTWNHICFTRSYYGVWALNLNGNSVKRSSERWKAYVLIRDGSLIVGQKQDSSTSEIEANASFTGHLTQFLVLGKYYSYYKLAAYYTGCLEDYGLIPWPEAQFWKHGNVFKYDVSLCKNFKVDHHWKVVHNGSTVLQDLPSRGSKIATMKHGDQYSTSMDLNVYSHDAKGCVELVDSSKFICINDPDKCLRGFTVSFWMKFGEKLISRILEKRTQEKNHLESFLAPITSRTDFLKWSLCYRASKHGWDPSIFHSNCDSKSPTLTIVRVKDFIFGGYTDQIWGKSSSKSNIWSKASFLFSLKNPDGCLPFKLHLRRGFENKAIKNQPYSGPVFGLDDIHLGAVSFSDLGMAYDISQIQCSNLPNPITRERARKVLTGSYYFVPDEIEVFEYISNATNFESEFNILSSYRLNHCGFDFRYNYKGFYSVRVHQSKFGHWLKVPVTKVSIWSLITVSWSPEKGLRFIQDGEKSDAQFGMWYRGTTKSCLNTYSFLIGCNDSAANLNLYTMNFQLTDLKMWDSDLSYKQSQEVISNKRDVFQTAEIQDIAYMKEASSYLTSSREKTILFQGHRRNDITTYCFRYNSGSAKPWLEIDLRQRYIISDIFITVYSKYHTAWKYLSKFEVLVSDRSGSGTGSKCGGYHCLLTQVYGRVYCEDKPKGRYVRIASKADGSEFFGMCSVEVKGFHLPGYWMIDSEYPRLKGEKLYYRTDFVFSSKNCLTFLYMINGTDPGHLNVYLGGYLGKKTLLWRLAGYQGEYESWREAQVPIAAEIAYQIIFEAVVGKENAGIIAVDNVTLSINESCFMFSPFTQSSLSGMKSNMIGHIPTYQDWLLPVLSQAGMWSKYWEPCYHALSDGWNGSKFVGNCQGKGPLVVLIRKESKIFGGFTDVNHLNDYIGTPQEYAFNRPARLSSKYSDKLYFAKNAVDGKIHTFAHTRQENNPWWSVYLDRPIFVTRVYIANRQDCCRYRTHNFKILVSRKINGRLSAASCSGSRLLSMNKLLFDSFSCIPPLFGNNVTIHKIQNKAILNIGEVKVFGYEGVPSSNAFLFTFGSSQFGSKMELLPGNSEDSTFFVEQGIIFGRGDFIINITARNVIHNPGSSYELPPDGSIAGDNNFQPDDIEVLVGGELLSRSPCLEGELYDKIGNKCVCDFGRRDYELCLDRRTTQDKLDQICNTWYKGERYFARYVQGTNSSTKRWRCCAQSALTDDGQRYNLTKQSVKCYEKHSLLKKKYTAEFANLVYDLFLESAVIHWPMDNKDDLKCLKSGQWASSGDAYNVRGVINKALNLNDSTEIIKLPTQLNFTDCLFNPGKCTDGLTVSMWLKSNLESPSEDQIFWTSRAFPDDLGFTVFQPKFSSSIAINVSTFNLKCTTTATSMCIGIWFELVFSYKFVDGKVVYPNMYINGLKKTNNEKSCELLQGYDHQNNFTSLGRANASVDELVIIQDKISEDMIHDVYDYYKGKPNLHLSTIVLTDRSWNSELLNKKSDLYQRLTAEMTSNISQADKSGSIKKFESIKFSEKDYKTMAHLLVSFSGETYSFMENVVQYLENTYTILELHSNDVYIKPLDVSYKVNETTIILYLSWHNVPRSLSHGVLKRYGIFYKKLNELQSNYTSTCHDNGLTVVTSIDKLEYYTKYSISVRTETYEGFGKLSKPINITTGVAAPRTAPEKLYANNASSTSIEVRWSFIPEKDLRGPVGSYKIMYMLASISSIRFKIVKASHNVTIIGDLQEYSKYNVSVCGISIWNHIGPCRWTETMTDDGVPSMSPQTLSINPLNSSTISISWTDIPKEGQHGIIVSCNIKWNEVNNSQQVQNSTISKYPRKYILRGLKKYTNYEIKLACSTKAGLGPYTVTVKVQTDEDVPDKAPTIFQYYNTSSTSMYLKWNPLLEGINGILRGCIVECKDTNGYVVRIVACNGILNGTMQDLIRHETYSCIIAGFTSKGFGVFSSPVNVTTDEDLPETGPSKLNPVSVESNSLTLSISPPSVGNANGAVHGYIIKLYDKLRNTITNITVNASSKAVLDSIKPNTDYEVSVWTYNSKGIGRNATIINIKSQEGPPTAPPSNVDANPKDGVGISVSWGDVDIFQVNGKVRSYVIIYYKLSAPDIKYNVTVRVPTSRRKRRSIDSYVLDGLEPYTKYGVQVLAVTVANGVPSIQFNVTSGQDVPSHYPQNLHAYNISSTSLQVTWDEVPDGHKNGIIIGYKIMYWIKGTLPSIKNVSDGNLRNTTLIGLKKYKQYNLTIRALTVVGAGNISEPVSAWTAEDVPDGHPNNVSSTFTLTTFTISWHVISKGLENGIIRGYRVAVLEMNGMSKTNITVQDSQILNATATGLDVWTNYTIQLCAFTIVGCGPWSPKKRYTTDEEAPQDVPHGVHAHFTSSTSIRVQWTLIDPALTAGIPRGYHIYYHALETPFEKPQLMAKVGANDEQVVLTKLYKYVEYEIYIKALTNKEGNSSEIVKAFTDQDKPDQPPTQLNHLLPTPTSIWLNWYEVNDGYRNGIIQGYKLTYRDTTRSDPAITKVHSRFDFTSTLEELPSYIDFEITLLAFTIKGDGPALKEIIKTDENKPSQKPQNVRAENHTTPYTLPVTWESIPYVPGILRGFYFRYKPVSTGDVDIDEGVTKELHLAPDQRRILLTDLVHYTRYRIEITGYTVKGEGPWTITFGETCRCMKSLSSSWISYPPYVDENDDGSLGGIMPSIVKNMVVSCCQDCKSHGLSVLDLEHDGYNQSARKNSQNELNVMIDGVTNVIFPIPGYKSQESYKTTYGYRGLVETPGVVFVFSSRTTDGLLAQQLILAILESWPLILISIGLALLIGCVIWALECKNNEEQFPKSYLKGCVEGFWFTFVSMTTVGYGDRCPSSILGRIVSIFWILFGVVLTGMIIGNIATAITSVAFKQANSIYGLKIGAIGNSFEYRFGVRRNALMNTERNYKTYEQIFEDIESGRIEGALLDAFAIGSRKDLFDKPYTKVKAIYDIEFVQGIVTAGNATKLNRCFRRYTRSYAKMISETVTKNVRSVAVSNTDLAREMSSGIFDENSPIFKTSLMINLGLLVFLLLLGTIYQVVRYIRSKNVSPDQHRLKLIEHMRKKNKIFYQRFTKAVESLKQKHKQEWRRLAKAKSKY